MKKIICLILVFLLCMGAFCACGTSQNQGKINIVTTIFPEYDWVKNIVGEENDDINITMLLDNGVDLHSFQPTTADILKISTCDMFVYTGGVSDSWVDDALNEATNKDMKVINLMDALGNAKKEEEVVEGMQSDEEEEESDDIEYDEHIWLSLKNAETLTKIICDTICEVDNENEQGYKANYEKYKNQLEDLDKKYGEVVNNAKTKTVLFGDRFPFRYLTDDYNLKYYAAFVGCSAESEASFETITFLSKKVEELKLSTVLVLDSSDKKIAKTIINNTKSKSQKIVTMNSMQSMIEDGEDYLSIMKQNLTSLEKALN